MAVQRMDNVGIVVEDLPATIAFFKELGLGLEGTAMVEGEWAGRVTGLGDQQVEIAMMRTPDGHSRLELCRFLSPTVVADQAVCAQAPTRSSRSSAPRCLQQSIPTSQTPADDSHSIADCTDEERAHWTHHLANLVLLNHCRNSAA